MQIALAPAAAKAASVKCRLDGRANTSTSPPPTEYKQACNFMGPLRVPGS